MKKKTINITYTTACRCAVRLTLVLFIFAVFPERMLGSVENVGLASHYHATLPTESGSPSVATVGETLPTAGFLTASEKHVLRAGGTEEDGEDEDGGDPNKIVDGPVDDCMYLFLVGALGYGLYFRRKRKNPLAPQ